MALWSRRRRGRKTPWKQFQHWFAHALIPRKSNRHRAWLLHPHGLATVATVIVGLHISLAIVLHFPIFPDVLGQTASLTPDEILTQVNEKRAEQGLNTLTINEQLSEAAEQKGKDMIANDYWAHTSPSGREPWDFILDAGYKYSVAGENLARNFHTTETLVSSWMASPTHRENILHNQYQETGIAIVSGQQNGRSTHIVVQLFGSPEKSMRATGGIDPNADPRSFTRTGFVIQNVADSASTNVLGAHFEITPIHFYRAGILTVLVILLGVLMFDMLTAERKNIQRNAGKNLAHIILLLAVITTVFLAEGGTLL